MQVQTPATESSDADIAALWPYCTLFFISGFPALIYQIVWQRALFAIYGVNIESVTVIVTVFMLGLGFGSLAGGRLSKVPGLRMLVAFGAIEIGIGLFGAASLSLFDWASSWTAGASTPVTALITVALLLIPTLLMGSTLPLLVTHAVRVTRNIGESVGLLYAVNTLGSAIACFAAAFFMMRWMGESGSVRIAAVMNAWSAVPPCCSHVLLRRFSRRIRTFLTCRLGSSKAMRHHLALASPCLWSRVSSPLATKWFGTVFIHLPPAAPRPSSQSC